MKKVFVTGLGIVSAIGDTVDENRTSLIQGRSGIGTLDLTSTRYASLLPFAEIKIESRILKEDLKVSDKGVTRTTLLAIKAFNEAIIDGGLSTSQLIDISTSLIGATTVGGMCLTNELYNDANLTSGGSEYLSSYDFASVHFFLQKRYQIQGIVNTFNTACSSSANAIMYGSRLIKNGLAKRVIVGGVDSLAKFTINGFNSLFILSNEKCKPFDQDRSGLNLGEAAAYLVLESEEVVGKKKVYAELTGYCNANDAFHSSSLSNEGIGAYKAMSGALSSAKILPHQISFINTHGTGTENNDLVESRAMLKLFGKEKPFISTKANTGHTLGAAGAVEAVFSVLNIWHQEIYPSLNFNNAIPETSLKPELKYRNANLQHVISNSFGFGGNCTSLIFSKI